MAKPWIKGILIGCALLLLVGCGGKSKGLRTVEGDPEALYREALALYNKRLYADALKKFEEIKTSFPDSPPYTLLAELKVADCHFHQGNYVEAAAAYEDFKKIHPTYEEIAYVLYQIGMSYYSQMLSRDRDQTFTAKALSSFEYLLANYPPSLFTEKAKEKVEICKRRLADHEFYIGDFYYRQGKYLGAASRFEGLLERFPDIGGRDKTLYLLGRCYLELGQTEKARTVLGRILSEYPKSPHSKEASTILDQGLKPKELVSSKAKAREATRTLKGSGEEQESLALVRFEEEGKKPLPWKGGRESRVEEKREDQPAVRHGPEEPEEPIAEEVTKQAPEPPLAPSSEELGSVLPPMQSKTEAGPEERPEIASVPRDSSIADEGKRKKEIPAGEGGTKFVDSGEPIDISSDKVESYIKENLIVFKGNVTARQKDIVIHADSVEAFIGKDGKGIEKVIADGNVKIQQGLRVAVCQRAIFYNLDRKLVMTGEPSVSEGENTVSGEEIVFDVELNRIEVKGGTGGRGKAKIYP